jgi:hypothetical protein
MKNLLSEAQIFSFKTFGDINGIQLYLYVTMEAKYCWCWRKIQIPCHINYMSYNNVLSSKIYARLTSESNENTIVALNLDPPT